MTVRPVKLGYYAYGDDPINHQRRYPAEYTHKPNAGAPFKLLKPEHFSPNWMEIVEATPEERAVAEKKVKFKGIDMVNFVPASAPGVKVKLSPADELAARHAKVAKSRAAKSEKPTDDEGEI